MRRSLVRVEGGTLIAQQAIRISIRYDLWDERFQVESQPDGAKRSFVTLAEAEAWIEAPGPFTWDPPATARDRLKIEALETLNPVSQERMAELQKWMIQQRLMTRVGRADGVGEVNPVAETPFSALFYSLWKRAASGELAGEIQRQAESGPFTLPGGGSP